MLPAFNAHGYLPRGIHSATIKEVLDRFGRGSDQREAQAQSLRWLIPLSRSANIVRILINGTFVTDRVEPNDVDCVLLAGPNYVESSPEAQRLLNGLPFIELKVVNEEDYDWYASVFFSSDRAMIEKGIVEVAL